MNKKTTQQPFYIDLRDTKTFVTDNNIVRQPMLEEIIDTVLKRQSIKATAENFLAQARAGKLIFIFDGLDEKLVHYTKDMRSQFLAELMRVFPHDKSREASPVKVVISCRSHHFEDLSAQNQFLRGFGRGDSKENNYRAIEMLPFDTKQ